MTSLLELADKWGLDAVVQRCDDRFALLMGNTDQLCPWDDICDWLLWVDSRTALLPLTTARTLKLVAANGGTDRDRPCYVYSPMFLAKLHSRELLRGLALIDWTKE